MSYVISEATAKTRITDSLFEAGLKCLTKCFLLYRGERSPDRDFYYLIGLRVGMGTEAVQHSLWADKPEDEKKIWRWLTDILSAIHDPVVIHYGRFETIFFRRMQECYGWKLLMKYPYLLAKIKNGYMDAPAIPSAP